MVTILLLITSLKEVLASEVEASEDQALEDQDQNGECMNKCAVEKCDHLISFLRVRCINSCLARCLR